MARILLVAILVLIPYGVVESQTVQSTPTRSKPAAAPAKAKPIANDDIIVLVKAGFGDDVVVARIKQAAERNFDVSTSGLIDLKGAGVSERVMTVMLGGPDTGPAVTPARTTPAADARPVATPALSAAPAGDAALEARPAGIYWKSTAGFVVLEPTVFSGGKSGGVLTSGLTMGIKKAKWKAVVRSPRAVQRVTLAKPEFVFYFESRGAGLSNSGGPMGSLMGASSPNEFVLARMAGKDDERELVVGQFGAFGASSGIRSEDTVELAIERLAPGVYRVAPREPLPAGEYCFFYAAGASMFAASGSGKLFDFGIDGGGL